MVTRTNVKVNMGLSVMRKRSDGFHDIETLFVPCFDLGDTLEVITGDDYSHTSASLFVRYGDVSTGTEAAPVVQGISEDGKLMVTIAREGGVDWDPIKDLCAKAYSLLAEDFDLPPVKIFLEKTAPVGAGLGGGSADAVFTLKALNELCSLKLSDSRLAEYAARLGSDCAFFIYNRPMLGTGRGEILEPFDIDLSSYDLKVLIPEGISVSTKEAYSGIIPRERSGSGGGVCVSNATLGARGRGPSLATGRVERSGAPEQTPPPLLEILRRPVEEWKDLVVNDFELTVFEKHPELAAIKQSLYDTGAAYASMSGSGPALFALYRK